MADAVKEYDIILDVTRPYENQRVIGRLADRDLTSILVKLTKTGLPINLTGYSIYFECRLPYQDGEQINYVRDDGSVYQNLEIVDASQGIFRYTFIKEVWSKVGYMPEAYFALEQLVGTVNKRVTTQNFSLTIQNNATNNSMQTPPFTSDIEAFKDAIRAELADVQTELDNTSDDVTALTGNVATLDTEVKALQASIDANQVVLKTDITNYQPYAFTNANGTRIDLGTLTALSPGLPTLDAKLYEGVSPASLADKATIGFPPQITTTTAVSFQLDVTTGKSGTKILVLRTVPDSVTYEMHVDTSGAVLPWFTYASKEQMVTADTNVQSAASLDATTKANTAQQNAITTATANAKTYTDNVVWSSRVLKANTNVYPNASQTVTFGKNITNMRNGIILVWRWDSSNINYTYTYVPKRHVEAREGVTVGSVIAYSNDTVKDYAGNRTIVKMVRLYNDRLVGHDNNANTTNWSNRVRLEEVLEY
ncbi:DUF2479 domain containing protein [Listeria phage LP-KV022]|uniref:DUF2479 domain containing protein n=5 Tax=Homburgvirus TaxID=1921125 RepID=A0A5A4K4E0_9CAUD|nr:virion structural protein [Listeria phage LP-110]YP_008240569.1 virion structural protein [Listeria phage LP-037]YP_009045154.1 virion structural protein [Listeria phage LP-114]AWY07645.1 DUF2479 domain containing protein [Listeria phage LP-KV022]QDK04844.1 hypothetical protein FK484_0111 [Listeria phage LP-031]AGI11566.1 DUF2479 domain containing protein [Listeria phage LP-110]AGI11706.1 DUF2479 domain containing protein [Listeria phage LP-037]AHL18688.1 DUF2479 domain-containing protein